MALNFFKKKEKKPELNAPVTIESPAEPQVEIKIEKANQDYLKSPEGTPPPVIEDLGEKQKEIKKKEKRFKITFYIFLFALFLLIFGEPAINFYKQHFIHQVPVVQNP